MKLFTIILFVALIVAVGITLGIYNNVLAQQTSIPSWIKNTAKWWGEGQISDSEFLKAIQWLIDQKILVTQIKSEPSQFPTQQSITSMQDLLPKQSDIGNEWHSSKILYGKNSYNDTINDNNTVVAQNFTQSNTNDKILVALYDFDSPDKAKKWNDKLISTFQNAQYSVGSVVDASIRDLCQIEDDTRLNSSGYTSIMFCHHGNFQFAIMGYNNTNSKVDMNKFAEIMLNKIWLTVNVNVSK